MDTRRLSYEVVAQAYVNQIKQNSDVIGILLAGSWLHGPIDPNSDIDVVVILGSGCDYRERGNTWIDDIEIEYFMNPVQQIRAYFKQGTKSPHTANMLATGKVVYSTSPLVEELIKEAELIWNTPPAAPSKIALELACYHLDDLRKDFEDALENEDALGTQLLRHQLINQCIDLFCQVHRLWRAKHKHLQAQLEPVDLAFSNLVQAALFEESTRREALLELLAYAEHMTDGPRPREWQLRSPLAL